MLSESIHVRTNQFLVNRFTFCFFNDTFLIHSLKQNLNAHSHIGSCVMLLHMYV